MTLTNGILCFRVNKAGFNIKGIESSAENPYTFSVDLFKNTENLEALLNVCLVGNIPKSDEKFLLRIGNYLFPDTNSKKKDQKSKPDVLSRYDLGKGTHIKDITYFKG